MTSIVALIPARAGSKRIPGKNIRLLGGHPLIAWTIRAALVSGIFGQVVVSTDSEEIAGIARRYGASAPRLRPGAYARDTSPDIDWLLDALEMVPAYSAFAILRPTSPFRRASTIRAAWAVFVAARAAHSLRAIESCTQHPCKMWVLGGGYLHPLIGLMAFAEPGESAHSRPTQTLPPVYVQNASLEMAWCRVPREMGTIAGSVIVPFITSGYDGLDLNHERDWVYAEWLLERGLVLPYGEEHDGRLSAGAEDGERVV